MKGVDPRVSPSAAFPVDAPEAHLLTVVLASMGRHFLKIVSSYLSQLFRNLSQSLRVWVRKTEREGLFSVMIGGNDVDISALAQEKPSSFKRLLHQSIELFTGGSFTSVEPITTFPYGQIEVAFRKMQANDHMGKIVVVPENGDRFKVYRCPKPPNQREN